LPQIVLELFPKSVSLGYPMESFNHREKFKKYAFSRFRSISSETFHPKRQKRRTGGETAPQALS
jgi:hypothetical protein